MRESETERMERMAAFDTAARGGVVLAGCDEAGRGPLAGDVFAAAVIFREGTKIPGLNDSKKLSEKKREALFDVIRAEALSYAVATASVAEIEDVNILNATFLAMRRAIGQLSPVPALVLVDGNRRVRELGIAHETVVSGDALSQSIAAASILAKVSRDRYMLEMAERYPGYGFEAHKGYGTAAHTEAIRKLGPSPIHRMSFLKNIVG